MYIYCLCTFLVECNNSQWRFAYMNTLVVCAHIANFDHVICLNVSSAFSNTVILVPAYMILLCKVGLLIITSRKSHLFIGVRSLKILWQNLLRTALGIDLEPLTPFRGLRDLRAQYPCTGKLLMK